MKKILVPTDFSECAGYATDAAIQIAKRIDAEIHFLHFLSIPMNWIQLEMDQDKMYPDIKTEINEAKSELKNEVRKATDAGVSAQFYLDYSESRGHVIDYISENKMDLVVMGSHGASGFRELFIGTNAQKIVRMSPIPVLIIKDKFVLKENSKIVFVSDFEPEVMHAFEDMLTFSESIGAKLHLIYINTPSYFNDTWEIKNKMESFNFLGRFQIENSEIIDAYVYEDGLEKYCENLGDSIVAMATHGRKGVSRIIYGSLTEKVVNHISMPVMSYRIFDEQPANENHLLVQTY